MIKSETKTYIETTILGKTHKKLTTKFKGQNLIDLDKKEDPMWKMQSAFETLMNKECKFCGGFGHDWTTNCNVKNRMDRNLNPSYNEKWKEAKRKHGIEEEDQQQETDKKSKEKNNVSIQ